ncbi:hypothetical protein M9H77_23919 [Catharanthus roseus]|uniref:Uncharacterized protein n=1 Tax=Catharanthus roseus TaxID=4058 RepID=A0ACC0AVG1_CATRO|nr:hypothetical protein M9H77_23919 [Catharanthus roseus]
MVQPSGRRGYADLSPVTDKTGRVEGRPITASSRGELEFSTQPPAVPFRSRPPLQPHLSHTPVPYEPYGSAHPPSHPTDTVYDPYLHAPTVVRPRIPYRFAIQAPILEFRGQPRQIGVEFFYQIHGAAPLDSSCSTYGYSHAECGVSSSDLYGDRIVGEEQKRVRSLHIQGEADERSDDDGDGGDDDQDDDDNDGDEEHIVYVAPVALGSGSDGHPRHEKGKGLTGSFMSVARDVPTLTQKRKKAAEGGLVNPELTPSYIGHVAGRIWRGYDHGLLKCRSRYMALTGWDLTDSQARPLASSSGFNASELHAVATSRQTSQSHQAWIYLYFPMFAPPFRHSSEGCKHYIQMFPTIGYKNENKLLDIRLRLDMMTADEVRWIPYRTQVFVIVGSPHGTGLLYILTAWSCTYLTGF